MEASTRLRPAPGVLSRRVGDDSVLLDPASGQYFELNSTGSLVWELLAASPSREELLAGLEAEFEAEPAELEADVDALLAELLGRGLVERA